MADIFSSKPGQVIAVTGTGLPLNISLEGWGGPGWKSIIQSIGVSGQGGYQFSHSLRDFIYVYVFGERVGQIQIGGLAFAASCDDDFDNPFFETGMEQVYLYYRRMRITSNPLPVNIAIGAQVSFTAFLTEMNVGITDPSTNIAPFTLRFHYVPDQVDLIPDVEITPDEPVEPPTTEPEPPVEVPTPGGPAPDPFPGPFPGGGANDIPVPITGE